MKRLAGAWVRVLAWGAGAVLVSILSPHPACAQPDEPVHGFVVDAQGVFASLPQNDAIATPRLTTADNLPSRGLGLNVGAHVLPLRWKAVTFGFGASLVMVRGSKTLDVVATPENPAPAGVRADMLAIAPQVSMNFGHRAGWSYLSGGIGVGQYRAWRQDVPKESGDTVGCLNFGGGARWFVRKHLAFSFDLRVLMLGSAPTTSTSGGHPSTNSFVISGGVSLR